MFGVQRSEFSVQGLGFNCSIAQLLNCYIVRYFRHFWMIGWLEAVDVTLSARLNKFIRTGSRSVAGRGSTVQLLHCSLSIEHYLLNITY